MSGADGTSEDARQVNYLSNLNCWDHQDNLFALSPKRFFRCLFMLMRIFSDKAARMTTTSTQAERVHFESIVQAFLYYRVHAYRVVSKGEASFSRLPRAHQKILSHIPAKFLSQKQVSSCVHILRCSV